MDARIRLPGDQAIGSLAPLELLELYWRASHVESSVSDELNRLATQLIRDIQAEAGD
jgi:hypothetical protein